LQLAYQGDGCERDDGRAIVEESAQRIAIRIEHTDGQDGFPCPSIPRVHRLRVTLRAPVAGRPIIGATLAPRGFNGVSGRRLEGLVTLLVIPRVIGLAPTDAARVLRRQGFAATTPRSAPGDPRPAITEQLPTAGIAVGGPGGPVRVRLSST
jgi:hypothetical protein